MSIFNAQAEILSLSKNLRKVERWTRQVKTRTQWDYNLIKALGVERPSTQPPQVLPEEATPINGLTTELILDLAKTTKYIFPVVTSAGKTQNFWIYPLLMRDIEERLGVNVNKNSVRAVLPKTSELDRPKLFEDWSKVESILRSKEPRNMTQQAVFLYATQHFNGTAIPTEECLKYCPTLKGEIFELPEIDIEWQQPNAQARKLILPDQPLKSFLDVLAVTGLTIKIKKEDTRYGL